MKRKTIMNFLKGAAYIGLTALTLKCAGYIIDDYKHKLEVRKIMNDSGVHPSWFKASDSEMKEFMDLEHEMYLHEIKKERESSNDNEPYVLVYDNKKAELLTKFLAEHLIEHISSRD